MDGGGRRRGGRRGCRGGGGRCRGGRCVCGGWRKTATCIRCRRRTHQGRARAHGERRPERRRDEVSGEDQREVWKSPPHLPQTPRSRGGQMRRPARTRPGRRSVGRRSDRPRPSHGGAGRVQAGGHGRRRGRAGVRSGRIRRPPSRRRGGPAPLRGRASLSRSPSAASHTRPACRASRPQGCRCRPGGRREDRRRRA